jgi:hypothetical protein
MIKFKKIIDIDNFNFNKIDDIIQVSDIKGNYLYWHFDKINNELIIFKQYVDKDRRVYQTIKEVEIFYYSTYEERKEKLIKLNDNTWQKRNIFS